MIQLKNEKNGEWQKMNNPHMFRKLFPNGCLIDVKYNPNGFGDMYSTNLTNPLATCCIITE